MRELAALFSACSIFIGNDSGAMHVAAAAGLPVIGIFGPTDPEGTAPLTPQFRLIQEPVSCSPCFLRSCPVDHRCMERISVDAVFFAAQHSQNAEKNSQHWSSRNV
jgi:heptosyltransferase-2